MAINIGDTWTDPDTGEVGVVTAVSDRWADSHFTLAELIEGGHIDDPGITVDFHEPRAE